MPQQAEPPELHDAPDSNCGQEGFVVQSAVGAFSDRVARGTSRRSATDPAVRITATHQGKPVTVVVSMGPEQVTVKDVTRDRGLAQEPI